MPTDRFDSVPEPDDQYLARVRSEIRAEAARLAERTPLAREQPAPVAEATAPEHERLRIGELTDLQHAEFVDHAFRRLLGRPPSEAERATQLALLGGGAPKAEVLGNLRWSPEGRAAGVAVAGLLPRYLAAKAMRLPLLGFLARAVAAPFAMPGFGRHLRAVETLAGAAREEARESREQTASLAAGEARGERRLEEIEARHARLANRLEEVAAADDDLRHRVNALDEGLRERHAELQTRLDDLMLSLATLRSSMDAFAGEHARARTRFEGIDASLQGLEASARVGEAVQRGLEASLRGLEQWVPVMADPARMNEFAALCQRLGAVNHWSHHLDRTFEEIEQAARARREQEGALAQAAGIVASRADRRREERNREWATQFAAAVPNGGGRTLTLATGGDWQEALAAAGLIAPEAGERPMEDILPATLRTELERADEASLDALASLALPVLLDAFSAIELVQHAARVLRPQGVLLLAMAREPAALALSLLGKAPALPDLDALAGLLEAAGFVAVSRIDAADGTPALFAQRGPA